MKLENEITIPEPADKVYAILTGTRRFTTRSCSRSG